MSTVISVPYTSNRKHLNKKLYHMNVVDYIYNVDYSYLGSGY